MSDIKIDKLPDDILGSTQLYQIIGLLDAVIENKFSSALKWNDAGEVTNMPEMVKVLFAKNPTAKEVVELKDELEKIIQTAPVVRLTLSDSPDPSFSKELATWFRSIHPYCLVEILVDSSIIGGVIIRSGRRILDYSIRKQLNQKEDILTGILKNA